MIGHIFPEFFFAKITFFKDSTFVSCRAINILVFSILLGRSHLEVLESRRFIHKEGALYLYCTVLYV
jgi:hypothetical protein